MFDPISLPRISHDFVGEWNLIKIIPEFEGESIFLKLFRACILGGYVRMCSLSHVGGTHMKKNY